MEKLCNACNTSKSLSEFSKSKAKKDGLQYKCKECIKQHNKDNKEALAQYREDNKESIYEYNKQYREDNKEFFVGYYQDNKDFKLEYQLKQNISEGYGVYTLTHLPTQYFYIGEGQIHSRRIKHFSMLKRGCNPYGLLQEHYNKHPNIDEWQFEVIYKFDDYDKEAGLELEAFIIEESREKYPTQILNKKS